MRQHVPLVAPGVLTGVAQIVHPKLVERKPTKILLRKRTEVLGLVVLSRNEGRNHACALRLRAAVEPASRFKVSVQGGARLWRPLHAYYAHTYSAHAPYTQLTRARACVPMGCKRELSPGEEAAKVAASARAEKKRHHHYQNVHAQARHKLSRWEVEPRPRFPRY